MPLEWTALGEVIVLMDFSFWVDGQPIGGEVVENSMDVWVDGQPIYIEVDV